MCWNATGATRGYWSSNRRPMLEAWNPNVAMWNWGERIGGGVTFFCLLEDTSSRRARCVRPPGRLRLATLEAAVGVWRLVVCR
jgi:hypothetical protein